MATMTAPSNKLKNGTHDVNGGVAADEQPTGSDSSARGTVQQVREELYTKFNDALDKTKQEVQEMQKKLKEYDEKLQASATVQKQGEKASEFFRASLEEIKSTLDSLATRAQVLYNHSKEFTLEKLAAILAAFNEAVDKLKSLALEFDEKYQVSQKFTDLFAPLFARLKSVDQLKGKVKDLGSEGRSFLINTAANLETKFHIESTLSDLDQKYKIVEKAKQLQEKGEEFIEKQQLGEKLKELDEKITGSKAGTYLEEGVKIFTKEWEKVHQDFEIARNNSRENLEKMAAEAQKTK